MASLYPSRRAFFKTGITGGISMFASGSLFHAHKGLPQTRQTRKITQKLLLPSRYGLDLTPARWIWYPADRTLQNTFILFRKSLQIDRQIVSAKGWILGDSRYLLEVNGKRVQWGPAPSDPRFSEADPIDLTATLQKGDNIIGATVLYYGQGDGTWPVGKPGFIFYLDIVYSSREKQLIVSDDSWYCLLARAWRPGQYKRWYLRALQEEFDARSYPYGWSQATYNPDSSWIPAYQLTGKANQPALATSSNDYLYNSSISEEVQTELRKRAIPLILEKEITNPVLEESLHVDWIRPICEFFEMGTYNAVKFANEFVPELGKNQELILNHPGGNTGTVLTFSFSEQIVGWPGFEVFAPEGTAIELMVQEGHRLVRNGGPVIMNNHFHSWTRFTCTSGKNRFLVICP